MVYFELNIEPDKFKRVEVLINEVTTGTGRVEVLLLKSTSAAIPVKEDDSLVKGMNAFSLSDTKIESVTDQASTIQPLEVTSLNEPLVLYFTSLLE
jgi:hypothetical protein